MFIDRLDTVPLKAINHRFIGKLKTANLVLITSILIGLIGRLSFPLPFSPIPMVIQGHLCLFLAICLGRSQATVAVLLFLFQGACGLPVFALGHSGLSILFGPRGGFLFGYAVATWMTGYVYENSQKIEPFRSLIALIIGSLCINVCGLAHLLSFFEMRSAFYLGIAPFILGDTIKVLVFSKLATLNFFSRIKMLFR